MLLQKIRDHAKGWFAYTIVGLLTIPFAVWGIYYYFEGGGPMDAAVVGEAGRWRSIASRPAERCEHRAGRSFRRWAGRVVSRPWRW